MCRVLNRLKKEKDEVENRLHKIKKEIIRLKQEDCDHNYQVFWDFTEQYEKCIRCDHVKE